MKNLFDMSKNELIDELRRYRSGEETPQEAQFNATHCHRCSCEFDHNIPPVAIGNGTERIFVCASCWIETQPDMYGYREDPEKRQKSGWYRNRDGLWGKYAG